MSVKANTPLETAAEHWVQLQEREPSAEEVSRWLAWMDQQEGNTESFKHIDELARRLQHTREVMPERLEPLQDARKKPPLIALALAASVILAVGAGLVLHFNAAHNAPHTAAVDRGIYSTSVARQREVVLPDGSRVTLGGASGIEAVFSTERREVTLLNGEAFFSVQPDPTRPFVVNGGIATVRALGTAFNVRKNDGRLAVTVTEGRVEVQRPGNGLERLATAAGLRSPPTAQLGRAEQLIVEDRTAALHVVKTDPQRASAWRQGRLEFADEPLDVVIDNVSRYSQRALRADDPRLHSITYTGTFVPGQLDSWLSALETVFGLRLERHAEVTTVRLRGGTP